MRRAAGVLELACHRDTLREAWLRAIRGRRLRAQVRDYSSRLEDNLALLGRQLRAGTFEFGNYHQFVIHDPKRRVITAPSFPERIAHHALMLACHPTFERWLIPDTYACRVGRGRLAALARAQHFARRHDWYLKLDVRKYFDSISHVVLRAQLERLFKDNGLLHVLSQVIHSYEVTPGHGLPIGALTSQHFANIYLGPVDRLILEQLRPGGYVRYMDDLLIWGSSVAQLKTVLAEVTAVLQANLQLEWKPSPQINRTRHGVDFLGVRLFRERHVPNARSRVRALRVLKQLWRLYISGRIDHLELQRRSTAVLAFLQSGTCDSGMFRARLVRSLEVCDQ